jgi:hypothetical protein
MRRFDAVVRLRAPTEVMLDRIAHRTTNEYGKSLTERDVILDDLANVEPRASRPMCSRLTDRVTLRRDEVRS